ncbi:uncharacterized protein [Elaeis guineensis]|uniref:Uncharacterized protein LOC105060676 n=1 Tax=Elaeis guineensis var. tenera TaxID=51953 RepID=A0A6I9SH47_ELAGV|nr:uncharacterized protein LOC105060676 [Elaeis guineensis]
MFCGTGSFKRIDEEPRAPGSAPGSPKGSKKKANKNPYSTRGLDKFSTVLAELEARREKIMAKVGRDGVSMVRFMYSNSQDWVPIIVKLREDAKQEKTKRDDAKKLKPLPLPPSQPTSEVGEESSAPLVRSRDGKEVVKEAEPATERKVKKCFTWGAKEGEVGFWRWRPSYYWPLVIVLILVCLVMFGRVFAICCTSIWWYLVPTMRRGSGNVRRSMKKKDYGRRLSDKRLGTSFGVAPSSQAKNVGGAQEMSSPRAYRNGKRG